MRVLARLFRRRFLEELQRLHDSGALRLFGEHASLADAAAFKAWLAPLRKCKQVVYANRPIAGPPAVLAYLSRSSHHVVVSKSTLLAMDRRLSALKAGGRSLQGTALRSAPSAA